MIQVSLGLPGWPASASSWQRPAGAQCQELELEASRCLGMAGMCADISTKGQGAGKSRVSADDEMMRLLYCYKQVEVWWLRSGATGVTGRLYELYSVCVVVLLCSCSLSTSFASCISSGCVPTLR
jgi:hypothetical protein